MFIFVKVRKCSLQSCFAENYLAFWFVYIQIRLNKKLSFRLIISFWLIKGMEMAQSFRKVKVNQASARPLPAIRATGFWLLVKLLYLYKF